MICEPCREGGKWNAVDAVQPNPNVFNQAIIWHAQCKGGTWCDCQHVVGRTAKAGREAK